MLDTPELCAPLRKYQTGPRRDSRSCTRLPTNHAGQHEQWHTARHYTRTASTSRPLTILEPAAKVAAIAGVCVVVVAHFAHLHDSVAARGLQLTLRAAAVAVHLVAIVAGFAHLKDFVPTPWYAFHQAVRVATVARDRVVIVTLLGISLQDTVTAEG